eukprot:6749661-Alexandrium_andersonii.AAC.1
MIGAVFFAPTPSAGRLLGPARSGEASLGPSTETLQPAKHAPPSLIQFGRVEKELGRAKTAVPTQSGPG